MMGLSIQNICVKATLHIILCLCLAYAEYTIVVPLDPVIGSVGHNVILPCQLSSQASAVAMGIRWFRKGHFADYLYWYQDGKGSVGNGYEGRADLFTPQLGRGNMSLLLKNVQLSDAGSYKCQAILDDWIQEPSLELQVIQHGSLPLISLVRHHRTSIELSCSSDSWSPAPHIRWIDRRGKEITTNNTKQHQKASQGGILYSVTSHMNVKQDQREEVICAVMSHDRKYKLESAVQITEEFAQDGMPGRVYVAAFVIPVFLAMVTITASVLYGQHQKKDAQEKLKPIAKKDNELKEKDKEIEKLKETYDKNRKLMDIVGKIPEIVWTLVCQHADDVTLDPDTAHPNIKLADDERSVEFGDKAQVKKTEGLRFTERACVLGKVGYDSGRHYWEIDVGGKTQWIVGVAKEPKNRGSSNTLMYPEHGYWSIRCENEALYTVQTSPVPLPPELKPKRLGVFVDYEKPEIVFFNVEKRYQIHSYSNEDKFTEKVYPFIGPLTKGNGKLRILPKEEVLDGNDTGNKPSNH